jgi:hypothetical protein
MTKPSKPILKLRAATRTWRFNTDLYVMPPAATFSGLRDDDRIRRALKRAIEKDTAPKHLIDAVRSGIRG